MAADIQPSTTETIEIDLFTNKTGHHVWIMNNQTQRADYNAPILLLANERNYSYPLDPEWNVYNFGTNNTVRIVMNNKYQSAHPMHIHGHNFVSCNQVSAFPQPYLNSTDLILYPSVRPLRRRRLLGRPQHHQPVQPSPAGRAHAPPIRAPSHSIHSRQSGRLVLPLPHRVACEHGIHAQYPGETGGAHGYEDSRGDAGDVCSLGCVDEDSCGGSDRCGDLEGSEGACGGVGEEGGLE